MNSDHSADAAVPAAEQVKALFSAYPKLLEHIGTGSDALLVVITYDDHTWNLRFRDGILTSVEKAH